MPEDAKDLNNSVDSEVEDVNVNNNVENVESQPVSEFAVDEPETPPIHPELAITQPPPKKSRKKLILIVITMIFVLAVAMGGGYWYIKQNEEKPVVTNTSNVVDQNTQQENTEEEIPPELKKFIEPTTGETWLSQPKKLSDQGFLKSTPDYERTIAYYEVGARNGKTIIISVEQTLGDIIYVYEKDKAGKVVAVIHPDGEAVYNEDEEVYLSEIFAESVTVDDKTHYDSLTLPNKIALENGYSLGRPSYPSLGDFVTDEAKKATKENYTLIKKYGGSTLEKYEYTYPDTNLTSIGYTITYPTNTKIGLTYEPLEKDLEGYQWSKGSSYVTDEINGIARGCGNSIASVTKADKVTEADVEVVGKSKSGEIIYQLKSNTHPLVKKAYEEFVEFSKQVDDAPYKGISVEDFVKEHAVILHKDKEGQWLVYARAELRPAYGCAKPVVYLYPETAQNVTVRVGADVKVSEPFYNPVSGWSAWAEPSGKLTVSGFGYDSLFWEGPGWGEYPIVNKGLVVPTSDAIKTIRIQLTEQGLNQKEINDFVEYWQPNLPNKPFIRLTWLNTQQLDKLAPLAVNPKPDTVIRVFLDYAGLDEPIKIERQNLSAIPREGFTLIEWGGLATKKIY